jgi:hypothetical protein
MGNITCPITLETKGFTVPIGSTVLSAPLNQSVRSFMMTMAVSGAIAAVSAGSSALANPRTLVFGNSNGVTFGLSGSTITASAAGGGGGEFLSFSNANNVTFGKAGSTITASASFSQSVQPQSAFVFSDGGGISFGTNGSTVTATVKTDYLTTAAQSNHIHSQYLTTAALSDHVHGQYLTTAMASNAGTLFMGTSERANYFATAGNTFANSTHSHGTVAATNISATSASSGLSLSVAAQSVQTQSRFNATFSGNTAGVMAQVSSGVLTLAGGNNITLSQNGNAVTISGANVGGAQTGISGMSAGTTQFTSGTAVFSNSNGISFGANGNTITASHNALTTAAQSNHSHGNPTLALTNLSGTTASNSNGLTLSLSANVGGGGGAGLSAGTQSVNTGTVNFANSNGISFGMSGSNQITASHNALTTARASNDGIGLNTAATNVTWTVGSGGLSLNAGAYLTTAALSDHVHGQYLTTAAQSGHSHGVTLNLTNLNGTTGGNSAGINLSLSAIVPAQTVQPVAVSAANGSFNFSTMTLANSNGVSFSTGTQGVYATVATNYAASNVTTNNLATSQSSLFQHTTATSAITAAAFPAANSTNLLGTSFSSHSHGNPTLALTNISGTTASNSAGLTLSLSAAAPGAGGGAALSAGTQSANTGTIAFANSNGISFGMSGSSQITASYTVPTIPGATAFSNSNNVSFGLNGSTITATATWAQSVQTQGMVSFNGQTGALSRAVGSSLSSSVNGASTTIGLASNITTALQSTGAYLTTAMQSGMTSNYMSTAERGNYFYTSNNTFANSTHSHGNPTLNLTNISGTTASGSAGLTLSLSAAAPGGGGAVNVSAGTTSGNLQTIQFSNANGVSFGLNGSTITASAAGGAGGGFTASGHDPFGHGVESVAGQQGAGTLFMLPLGYMPTMQFNHVAMPVQISNASNSSNSWTLSASVGIYSKTGFTFSLITSVSHSWNGTASGSVGSYSLWGGIRKATMGLTTTLPEGNYWAGVWSRTSANAGGQTLNQMLASQPNSSYSGLLGVATNATDQMHEGLGRFSVSFSTDMPSSVALSHIQGNSSILQRPPIIFFGSAEYVF